MKQLHCLLLLLPFASFAQPGYFQQETHYTIQATLNDQNHTLDGHIRIEYVNHAPDTLREIWMHLWANAYKNRNTAFCRQKLRNSDAVFYFAPDSTYGAFQRIAFTVDEQPAGWQSEAQNPDIAVLKLQHPLPPGGRTVIQTPFLLKIPASFSRLGHVRTSYQMTQWYPKPAVYDRYGWHAMPYLDMGEFYSEFGSFDVSITLPDNYVVGATGVLQNPEEIAFLQQKEAETRAEIARRAAAPPEKDKKRRLVAFPASSPTLKTLRYQAEQVHDFAWFADKRFFVLKDTARLGNGATVDCWAMFTAEDFDLWQKGAFYVRRAVEFYSRLVGDYPWPHATAVHSALSAGGGMEYPMITVIGNEADARGLDDVITHEVGHNWFYGILASNERDHPWMDEGINSYYEHRYMMAYYGSDPMDDMLPPKWYKPALSGPVRELACLLLARQGADTPPDTNSDVFGTIPYGIQVYMKPALCLQWLERAAGQAPFDQAMQAYYQRWRFRHPYPADLRDAWRDAGLEANWFFQTMQTQKRFDLALTRIKKQGDSLLVTVKNRGSISAPYSITAMKNGQEEQTIWYPAPDKRKTTLSFPNQDADALVLDESHSCLDLYRQNNYRRTRGLFPGIEAFKVKPLAPLDIPSRTIIGVLPWLAWNNYDKTTLGLALYNPIFPPRRFQYLLMPGYGLASRRLTGLADLSYTMLPGGWLPKLAIGFQAKMADYDNRPEPLAYYRLAPRVRATLRSQSPAITHELTFRTLFIGKQEPLYGDEGSYGGGEWYKSTMHDLQYEATNRALPNPFRLNAGLEWQRYTTAYDGQTARYLRGTLEWKQRFFYARRRKVTARCFAGYFLVNTQRQRGSVASNDLSGDIARASFTLNPQGFNDYRFDQYFLGRTETEGVFAQQVSQSEGGFKTAFGAPWAERLGNSNNFILALNLKADLPQRLPLGIPLKPYLDLGYYDDATPLGKAKGFSDQFLWSGGLMLEFFNGTLEVYFPVVQAKPIRDLYTEASGNNYWRRISWSFRLGRITFNDGVQNVVL